MIDVIIPTMWVPEHAASSILRYCLNPNVHKVIVIDNATHNRPKNNLKEILTNNKVELVSYGKNMYVNPSWNEGYYRSNSDIIAIINDDIVVEDDVFDMVLKQNLKHGDLIGVNLRGYQDNYKIDDVIDTQEKIVKLRYNKTAPIGSQAWAFGICMFMLRSTYTKIPSLYQIWYGDDYLAQRAKEVYGINTNKIKGRISETLKKFSDLNNDISKRIELDSKNFLRYGHFVNGENWDIPKNIICKHQSNRFSVTKEKNGI
jgi:GT2 family glycosyltransferase